MKATYSNLMQSKYFSPAFNSAIFDGPVRIYFAQFHESFALKLYFLLQNNFSESLAKAKEISKSVHSNILVMVYPSQDNFILSFDDDDSKTEPIVFEKWNQDLVIGLRQPLEDSQLDYFAIEFQKAMDLWMELNRIPPQELAL